MPAFDSETAAEAGKASGEARRRLRKTPMDRAMEAAGRAAPQLLDDLLAAAKGEGVFADLPSKLRLTALMRALEYALGRPTVAAPKATDPDVPEDQGIRITG